MPDTLTIFDLVEQTELHMTKSITRRLCTQKAIIVDGRFCRPWDTFRSDVSHDLLVKGQPVTIHRAESK